MSQQANKSPTISNLAARRHLNALGTFPADRFERYGRLVRHLLDLPNAAVSFYLNDGGEPPPAVALCKNAMGDQSFLVVTDAGDDPRFANNSGTNNAPAAGFYAARKLQDVNGQCYGLLCITDAEPRAFSSDDQIAIEDIAKLAMDEIAARQLAVTDELTGLANRRGFELLAEQSLALCRRMEQPAVVVMLDLADLGSINDLHGFAAGDRVISNFADLLITRSRASDVIARIGGDEFAIVLSGTDATGAKAMLTRLRANLTQANETSVVAVDFNAGYALYTGEAHQTVFDALRDADEQMYRSRNSA